VTPSVATARDTNSSDATEIGAICLNSTPNSGASFSTSSSNVNDCLRVLKALQRRDRIVHPHKKNWRRNLASNLGIWRRFLERVFGASIRGLKADRRMSVGLYVLLLFFFAN